MPDDFHAYKSNYPPGCSDADVAEHYDGGDDVERGEELNENDQQEKDKVNGTDSN